MTSGHEGQSTRGTFRIATLNVHEWRDDKGVDSIDRIAQVLKPLDLDILALEEVSNESTLKILSSKIGLTHYLFCEADVYHGNAVLSKQQISSSKKARIGIGLNDVRSILQVVVDHEFMLDNAASLSVTHLDHASEEVRIEQLETFHEDILSNYSNKVQIVVGDFNSLTLDDYSPKYLEQIAAVRRKTDWEIPKENATLWMKKKNFVDVLKQSNKHCLDEELKTCRFNTRVDYIFLRGELKEGWSLSDCKILSSGAATDHEIVMATFCKH
ncbi:glyS [Acrasis kona]|uniref:GlyS n=1 Tax=Acrasis kona TaxID=1008807 RepID=A0AAW2YUW0_9EUKA